MSAVEYFQLTSIQFKLFLTEWIKSKEHPSHCKKMPLVLDEGTWEKLTPKLDVV